MKPSKRLQRKLKKKKKKSTIEKAKTTISKDEIYISDENGSNVSISFDGITLKDGEDSLKISGHFLSKDDKEDSPEKKKQKIISLAIWGISIFSITLVYILIGFFIDKGWSLYWPLFLFVLVIPSIYDSISKKNFCSFLYPLLISGIYCFIVTILGLWHPYCFLSLTIPVYYAIFTPIDKLINNKEEKN